MSDKKRNLKKPREMVKCKYSKCDNLVQVIVGTTAYCCKEHGRLGGNENREKTLLERYGVDNPNKSQIFREKGKQTCIERYGVDNPRKSKQVRQKIENTCLERYGHSSPLGNKDIQEKGIQTRIETYGAAYPMQVPESVEKTKQTNLERYGVEWNISSDYSRDKQKQTNLERYGVEWNISSDYSRDKQKQTLIEKYNVDNPTLVPEIFQKAQTSGKRVREYTLPSGNIIKLRGYETYGMDFLLSLYDENDIKHTAENIPAIYYDHPSGDKKRYYPDFYVESIKTIFEIKSDYTYLADLVVNMRKKDACLDYGFDFVFVIFTNKAESMSLCKYNKNRSCKYEIMSD